MFLSVTGINAMWLPLLTSKQQCFGARELLAAGSRLRNSVLGVWTDYPMGVSARSNRRGKGGRKPDRSTSPSAAVGTCECVRPGNLAAQIWTSTNIALDVQNMILTDPAHTWH